MMKVTIMANQAHSTTTSRPLRSDQKPTQLIQHLALNRRLLIGTLLTPLVSTLSSNEATAESTNLTPYQRGKSLEYGLTASGRIPSCDAVAQPSCISTSSLSNLYSPPWTISSDLSVADALEEFENALKTQSPSAEVVEKVTTDTSEYRRYKVPAPADTDYIEILISKQEAPYDKDLLVTYRSQASSVKYLWPITQPISDLGAQRKRMTGLRNLLGWKIVGCDQLECYQE